MPSCYSVLSRLESAHFAVKVGVVALGLFALGFFLGTHHDSWHLLLDFPLHATRSTDRFRIRRPSCGLWQLVLLIIRFFSCNTAFRVWCSAEITLRKNRSPRSFGGFCCLNCLVLWLKTGFGFLIELLVFGISNWSAIGGLPEDLTWQLPVSLVLSPTLLLNFWEKRFDAPPYWSSHATFPDYPQCLLQMATLLGYPLYLVQHSIFNLTAQFSSEFYRFSSQHAIIFSIFGMPCSGSKFLTTQLNSLTVSDIKVGVLLG